MAAESKPWWFGSAANDSLVREKPLVGAANAIIEVDVMVPSLSVETLLLDAYRRADEGERPWREKISREQELCLTCTIDCTAQIKSRYLKPDLCLWRSMPAVLKDPIYRGLQKLRLSSEGDEGPDDLLFI